MTHSAPIRSLVAAAAAPLAALAVIGCGGGNQATGSTGPPHTASGRTATIGIANDANLGNILVDSRGRTLYLFAQDTGTKSTCAGGCAAAWPPLRAPGKPVLADGLSVSKVGTTARSDGGPQVTYNGHPLYLYTGDQKPGETNGQGLTAFGAAWFALSPAGDRISGKGSSSGANSPY
jgi:predicted lipoprotein with Yx(FWY)xxD motif